MKYLKKTTALLLSVLLLFSAMVTGATVLADGNTATITVASVEAAAGANVEVPVTISGSDIGGAYFTVDVDGLTVNDVTIGENFKDWGNDELTYALTVAADEAFSGEAVLVTLNVAVPADAEEGAVYDITFTDVTVSGWNDDVTDVATTVEAGAVTVKAAEVECDHANADLVLKEVTSTEFVYMGTCADCGEPAEKRVEIGAPLASPITISKTIQPRNDVSILVEVPSNKLTAYTDYVVIANKDEYPDGATEPVVIPYYITEYAASTVYSGYTEFVFGKINAYEMNNNIHFVLYGKDATGKMIQLGTLDYSVTDYAVSQLSKKLSASVTAELKTTLVDMLIYSSKVQVYADYNEANLAVDRLAGVVETGTNKDVMEYATPESEWPTTAGDVNALTDTTTHNVDNTTPAGKLGLSRSLLLSNRVNTQFVVTSKGTADINDLYIKYEYYDVQGNPATPKIAKYENELYQGRYPCFVFIDAPVSVYDYPIKATVYYGNPDDDIADVEVAYTSYSPASYIAKYAADGSTAAEELRIALRALNAYAKSLAVLAGVTPYVAQ